jgi:MFS family permease
MTLAILPRALSREAKLLYWGRGLRAFGDGFISLVLPLYLTELGFDPFRVGVITAGTLLGSAALTIWVGFAAHRHGRRLFLVGAALLMTLTGAGFLFTRDFWPLLAIAVVGTLNPSSGDVSLFLPLEQALLAEAAPASGRTSVFAVYALIGTLVGALGSLMAAAPSWLERLLGTPPLTALQAMFAAYMLLGLATYYLYRRLPASLDRRDGARTPPLGPSRRIVLTLAALFSLDAFGGGLFVQSMLALWLYLKFGLSAGAAGAIFFGTGIAASLSYLAAAPLAQKIGLINTMVFTHFPSNLCLVALPFAPDLGTAVALIVGRSLLSQMDVPVRSAYVMSVVTPPERSAAASVTALPRSLAAAFGPLVTGPLLMLSATGWPFLAAGVIKGAYDVMLLVLFRRHPPRGD